MVPVDAKKTGFRGPDLAQPRREELGKLTGAKPATTQPVAMISAPM
jgi:hypothetical protein